MPARCAASRNGRVITGFAGATADAFTLLERLEAKLERFPDQLERAAVELAKDWRTDRYLRRLEALLAVADKDRSLLITGQGDVLEPEDGVIGIGSGGNYALAAARALIDGGRARRRGDRPARHDHRRRHLRLHQRPHRAGDPVMPLDMGNEAAEAVNLSPREIVSELDRFIVGQHDAKRAVAIALRNRWRRQQLPDGLREEVVPKNILMIGPTGCGKTEIARRLARLANAPFLKVEATKFTEVGYVGRDVDSIVRDLVEATIAQVRETARADVQAKAEARRRGAAGHGAGGRGCLGRDADEVPPDAARRRARGQGGRGPGRRGRRHADRHDGHPRHAARRPDGQHAGDDGQDVRRPHQGPQDARRRGPRPPLCATRPTSCSTTSADPRRRGARRESRHRLPRRDRQGLRPHHGAASGAATCPARACSATCCR